MERKITALLFEGLSVEFYRNKEGILTVDINTEDLKPKDVFEDTRISKMQDTRIPKMRVVLNEEVLVTKADGSWTHRRINYDFG